MTHCREVMIKIEIGGKYKKNEYVRMKMNIRL